MPALVPGARSRPTSPDAPTAPPSPAAPSDGFGPGIGPWTASALVLAALALHGGDLSGPFPDGQHGNCGAAFALMARNALALGWSEAGWVPAINPVPPGPGEIVDHYTHHPPGMPWLIFLAARVTSTLEVAARAVALLLTIVAALLAADLASRLASRRGGWATGALMLVLPAGLHHGLMASYESAAIPGLLYLTRALVLGRGGTGRAATLAAFTDWVALAPLAFAGGGKGWWRAALAGAAVVLGVFLLNRGAAPISPSKTLVQALGATFLSPAFRWAEWWHGVSGFTWTLFGWALVPAALGTLALPWRTSAVRRALAALLLAGLANLVVFAHHATTHEQFAMVLLPGVALAVGTLLFPRADGPVALPTAALAIVVALSVVQYREEAPHRGQLHQARAADALAAVTDTDTIYLRPGGAGWVFLHRAARHVVPFAATDVDTAKQWVQVYRERFGLGPLPAEVFTEADGVTPPWIEALGDGETRGRYVFRPLPEP